jgi:hypothetical protein
MQAKTIHFIVMATTSLLTAPALAEQAKSGPSAATGSPSNATSTVSPTSAAQALDRPGRDEPSFDVSLGTSYASGDFGGATSSHIWSTALGARLSLGSLRLSASIPHMRIRSNGMIFTGIDSTPVIVARGTGRRTTYDGIGDLTLGATYTLPAAPDDVEIELSGRIKLPTASRSSGLSSRKVDYSAGVQATKVIGQMAPFVSATYRIFGDPQGVSLKDGVAASAGTSFLVDDRTVLLASYHYAQKASNLISDAHELFAGVSRSFADNRFRLSGYATAGLSNGAAGASGGVSISVRL